MSLDAFLRRLNQILILIASITTTLLYLYPVWQGCNFPGTRGGRVTDFLNTISQHAGYGNIAVAGGDSQLAPFRLLVLADPQLEGDSSLPDPEDTFLRKLGSHWDRIQNAVFTKVPIELAEVIKEITTNDIPEQLQTWRKQLDLFGNDYYLAHIFRTLHWWTKPTHVTVLGDLIGSQWVDDEEFKYRSWRYWNRVFAGTHKVGSEITELHVTGDHEIAMDDPKWARRIMNIAGNHDIGYAGDISQARLNRFEREFGKANWDVRFDYPGLNSTGFIKPSLHLVVFNSMLLDTPAMDESLQGNVYEYLNSIINKRVLPVEDHTSFTLLLTHVPLYKPEGVCTDSRFFGFFNSDDGDCDGQCKPGGLKEQNHLSDFASRPGMLEALFGMSGKNEQPGEGKGRPGLILNGHDHAGCDSLHYIPNAKRLVEGDREGEMKTNFETVKWKNAKEVDPHTSIREITLRSMMGEFGGNAGLLSAWFDFADGEWKYDIQTCKLGVQHIWWAIHVLDLVTVGLLTFQLVLHINGSTPSVSPGPRFPISRQKKVN